MGIGMGAAQEAGERKAAQGGGDFMPMIFWKDDRAGEGKQYKKIVRFLTDDVITCKIYRFVKGGPEGKGRDFIDPDSLKDNDGKPIFAELEGERDYFRTNNIMLPTYKGDMKPAKDIANEQTFGLAILREEYMVERDGRAVPVMRDLIEKRSWETSDGEKKESEGPVIGVIGQGYKNFWSALAGYFNRYGTICDRDYEITRKGNGTDTTYSIIRLDAAEDIPDVVDGKTAMAHYKPEKTLKDWIVPKARYDAAAQWLGEKAQSEAPATSTADQQGGDRVREPSGSAASDLRKELEDFKA